MSQSFDALKDLGDDLSECISSMVYMFQAKLAANRLVLRCYTEQVDHVKVRLCNCLFENVYLLQKYWEPGN